MATETPHRCVLLAMKVLSVCVCVCVCVCVLLRLTNVRAFKESDGSAGKGFSYKARQCKPRPQDGTHRVEGER